MITASKARLESDYAACDAADVSAENVDAQGREIAGTQRFWELLPQCNAIRP
jgi:hypothetical protein